MVANEPASDALNLAQLFRIPFQALVHELHERLAAAGYPDIRPPHSVIFAQLGPGGMRLTELAERTQLTKQLVGYLVDSLEERGYVERRPDPTDGRAKRICLTERGTQAAHVGWEIIHAIERDWAARMGDDEMAEVRCGLEQLIGIIAPSGRA
jgi:DNA-binding MarR family transcriptional regulator